MNKNKALVLIFIGCLSGCSELSKKLPWTQNGSTEQAHDEHGDEHGDEAAHEEGVVYLDLAQRASLNLTTAVVRSGTIATTTVVPAEVQFDPDHVAHLVPRVAGIVREVHAGIGDIVSAGELLAVLDSRELAETKSTYLASLAMWDLAKATNDRETRLFKQEISSEKDYLASKQAFEEARINTRTARQQLQALGLTNDYIDRLAEEETASLTRYEIRAPFGATIVERHITRGETVDLDDQVFFVAQLDTVWLMGRVTQRDIRKLKVGQRAVIGLDGLPGEVFEGEIDYIGSVLDPRSRTTEARVVLPNPARDFRAGMFGRMSIFVDEHEHTGTLLVPVDAVQRSTRGHIVYRVREEGAYEVVAVTVLHQSADFVEVQGPLEEGDLVSVGDTFVLKSEAAKEDMGGHSH